MPDKHRYFLSCLDWYRLDQGETVHNIDKEGSPVRTDRPHHSTIGSGRRTYTRVAHLKEIKMMQRADGCIGVLSFQMPMIHGTLTVKMRSKMNVTVLCYAYQLLSTGDSRLQNSEDL